MEQVSVRLPPQLNDLLEDKAEELGVKKSEKIRSDLLQKYGDQLNGR